MSQENPQNSAKEAFLHVFRSDFFRQMGVPGDL